MIDQHGNKEIHTSWVNLNITSYYFNAWYFQLFDKIRNNRFGSWIYFNSSKISSTIEKYCIKISWFQFHSIYFVPVIVRAWYTVTFNGAGCSSATVETLARNCPWVSCIVRVDVHDGRVALWFIKIFQFNRKDKVSTYITNNHIEI